jgi:hypothetical protein
MYINYFGDNFKPLDFVKSNFDIFVSFDHFFIFKK